LYISVSGGHHYLPRLSLGVRAGRSLPDGYRVEDQLEWAFGPFEPSAIAAALQPLLGQDLCSTDRHRILDIRSSGVAALAVFLIYISASSLDVELNDEPSICHWGFVG
jgi:hypothetical protein